jgi:hypothetical protein
VRAERRLAPHPTYLRRSGLGRRAALPGPRQRRHPHQQLGKRLAAGASRLYLHRLSGAARSRRQQLPGPPAAQPLHRSHRRLTGRPKRLNHQLIDLCHKGYAGNGQPVELPPIRWRPNESRRYYPDGAAAGRVWLRQQGRVLVYWQAADRQSGNRTSHGRRPRVCFWYMLGIGNV